MTCNLTSGYHEARQEGGCHCVPWHVVPYLDVRTHIDKITVGRRQRNYSNKTQSQCHSVGQKLYTSCPETELVSPGNMNV
jgi:hypothetical protein